MDKLLIYFSVYLVIILAVEGQYGYKRTKKVPIVVPDKGIGIPPCSIPCTREIISPECREETFGLENGRKCRGCAKNICKDNLAVRGGNSDFNRRHDGIEWQNGGTGINNDFLNQGNGGFLEGIRRDVPNRGQDKFFGNNPTGRDRFVGDGPRGQDRFVGDGPRGQDRFVGDGPRGQDRFVGDGPRGQDRFVGNGPGGRGRFNSDNIGRQDRFVADGPRGQERFIGDTFGRQDNFGARDRVIGKNVQNPRNSNNFLNRQSNNQW